MMEITTYERCDTMASGLPEDYLVGLTKPSVDRILKMDNPGDCLALYTFYCYTRKWQRNSAVLATSEYAMTGLGWGRDRFSNAKKQLKEAGFIDDVSRKGEDGRVLKWYVEVRFAQSATLANFHTTENLHCGKTPYKYLGMVNEIPSNGNQIQKENSAMASHSSNQFISETNDDSNTEDGIANAIDSRPPNTVKKVNSVSCAQIPPKTKSPRKPKLVDDAFITELKRLNPDKDVDKEVQMARTWILAKPERQFTQQFLSGWINRSKNTITPERFSNF